MGTKWGLKMTNKDIQKLSIKTKKYKVRVYENVYIFVSANGKKTFYARIRSKLKDKLIKLGIFNINYQLENAINDYFSLKNNNENLISNYTLRSIFNEFLNNKENIVTHKTYMRYISTFKIFAHLENYTLKELKLIQIIECLKQNGCKELTFRAFTLINQLYEFAICQGEPVTSPLASIKASALLGHLKRKNYATLTKDEDLARLFKIIYNSKAKQEHKYALVLQALTALRGYNIRALKWSSINFDDAVLSFSSEDMKMNKPFYLPLSKQAITILKLLKERFYYSQIYVFPTRYKKNVTCISDNTLRMLLRRGGISKDEFTPHGFRAMFSTIANDNNYSSEIIELCLAHTVGGVKGVYDRSHKLEAKRELMQWWGDYLEKFIKDFL